MDLHPETNLLPFAPVASAHARAFISTASDDFFPTFFALVLRGVEPGQVLGALRDLQALLTPEGGSRFVSSSDSRLYRVRCSSDASSSIFWVKVTTKTASLFAVVSVSAAMT